MQGPKWKSSRDAFSRLIDPQRCVFKYAAVQDAGEVFFVTQDVAQLDVHGICVLPSPSGPPELCETCFFRSVSESEIVHSTSPVNNRRHATCDDGAI